MSDFDPAEYVSTRIAARLLGVSSRTVRTYCEHSILPGARQWVPGSTHWLIPRAGLDLLLSGYADSSDTSDSSEK